MEALWKPLGTLKNMTLWSFLFSSLSLGAEPFPGLSAAERCLQGRSHSGGSSHLPLWKREAFSYNVILKWLALEETASGTKRFHSVVSDLNKMCIILGGTTNAGSGGWLLRERCIRVLAFKRPDSVWLWGEKQAWGEHEVKSKGELQDI